MRQIKGTAQFILGQGQRGGFDRHGSGRRQINDGDRYRRRRCDPLVDLAPFFVKGGAQIFVAGDNGVDGPL